MSATYTHHLAGAAEGQRIERHGLEVRLIAANGFIMRTVHCGNDDDARSACIWMADDAYREAEDAAREAAR